MLTLNQATAITKKGAIWLVIVLIIIMGVIGAFRVGKVIKNVISPEPTPPPTVSFGLLEEISFPASEIKKNYSYSTDTVTGGYPTFPDRIKVFKIDQLAPDILALQKAGKAAAQADFTQGPVRVKGNFYQWSDPNSSINARYIRNIFESEFQIVSDFLTNPAIQSEPNPPSPARAIEKAKELLFSISLLPNDLIDDPKMEYFSIKNSQLSPETSLANSQVVKINFFQKDKDKLRIFYPNPFGSTMSISVAGESQKPQIVSAEFFYQKISDKSATYPIITSEEAFKRLENGQAYIANPSTESDVSINKIYLAYFLGDKKQNYLAPIVVLEGTNGFIAYVPAIKDEWLDK